MIFASSASLALQIEFAPIFYLAAIKSRSESNSIPSHPKSHPTSIFTGWVMDCKKIENGILIIHCPSNKNPSRSQTLQKRANNDFHKLGIARFKNRIRSKIFLYCSDTFPKRSQFDPKFSKIHPTSIFRG